MDHKYWNCVAVDNEDDGSLTIEFHHNDTMILLIIPKDKIERIVKLYGAKKD